MSTSSAGPPARAEHVALVLTRRSNAAAAAREGSEGTVGILVRKPRYMLQLRWFTYSAAVGVYVEGQKDIPITVKIAFVKEDSTVSVLHS